MAAALCLLTAGVANAGNVRPAALLEGSAAGVDNVVLAKSDQFASWNSSANHSWLHLAATGNCYNKNHGPSKHANNNLSL